jgi:hypothetical protein
VKFRPAIHCHEREAAAACAGLLPGQWVRVAFDDGSVRTGRLVTVDAAGAVIVFGRDAADGRRFRAVRRAVRSAPAVVPAPLPVPAVQEAPAVNLCPAPPAPPAPVLAAVLDAPAAVGGRSAVAAPAVLAAGFPVLAAGSGASAPVPGFRVLDTVRAAGSRILRAAGAGFRIAADAVRSAGSRILRSARGDPPAFRA